MANEIKDKIVVASTAFTITLASLASSTAGAGRQSTIVDNTTTLFQDFIVYVQIKQGTNPTGNRAVYVYLIRDDNNASPYRSDGAAATDGALTFSNSAIIGVIKNASSPSTGDVIYGEFLVHRPGPKLGIGIVHDTGVNLDSTPANLYARYVGLNPEIQ